MCFFFFNDTATTEIYPLPLHAALPIYRPGPVPPRLRLLLLPVGHRLAALALRAVARQRRRPAPGRGGAAGDRPDRKSTRLNSSHANISYAVFCLKKKNTLTMTFLTVLF